MEVGLNKSVFSSISFDSTRLGFFFFFFSFAYTCVLGSKTVLSSFCQKKVGAFLVQFSFSYYARLIVLPGEVGG